MNFKACLTLLVLMVAGPSVAGQIGTAFSYQGELKQAGTRANGDFDFEFEMFDADTGTGAVAGPLLLANVTVADGVFTVELDFGVGAFAGQERWLEISVKASSDSSFTTLVPRQKINPAPYAIRSDTALVADGAAMSASADSVPFSGVTGVPAGLADFSMLTCGNGEIAVFNGSNWVCGASSDGDTLAGLACGNGQIPVFDGGNWLCGTPSSSYDNVIVVAPNGGDFSSIQAALSSINDAAADNRYLVWVAPGTYAESVTLEPFVDIEGSGRNLTTITAAGSSFVSFGTVRGADDAALRHVTVVSTGGNDYAVAVNNNFQVSPVLEHVTALASGGTDDNIGVRNNSGSDAVLRHVVAMGTGGSNAYGVRNIGSEPELTDVTATGEDGSLRNYGVHNISASPVMTRVTATASGAATNNWGVRNASASSPTVTELTATATGGTNNYAIQNEATVTLTRVKATAQGGEDTRGIYNDEATVTIIDGIVEASGASSDNYGVYNRAFSGVHEVRIDRSTVSGATASIRNDAEYTTFVSGSRLGGGAVQAQFGTFACVDSHDDIGRELTPACVANAEDGRAKAAVFANCRDSGSSISRSFSREGTTITISNGASAGQCTIDFGFSLSNRYWTATGVLGFPRIVTCVQDSTNDDELNCFRYEADGTPLSGNLMLTIH